VETTSPTMTTAAQAPSAMPTGFAQASVAPSAMSVGSPSQASAPAQQAMSYQAMSPVQAAQPGSVNPWQTAFQALSASLNTNNQSPAQAAYSAYQTPTPQATLQANWGSTAPSVAPTYAPQASTQDQQYSKTTVLGLLKHQRNQLTAAAAKAVSNSKTDAYLSQISDLSLEVLEHFGAEAPALLNQYACAVEDALIEQVKRGQSLSLLLEAAGEERGAMNLMLTNPDVLADYVNEFFGPNGPYPTMTEEEKRQDRRTQYAAEMQAYERQTVPPAFQRPQMEMPTPNTAASQAAGSFWGGFSSVMDNSPENAWKYLAQAPNGALQTKMLVQDL